MQADGVRPDASHQMRTSLAKPRRRGKSAATIAIQDAILEIVAERAPITVRGVAYALFAGGFIPDMSTGSAQKVSRIMTEMRERDALDWRKIVDGSRAVDRQPLWANPNEIINSAARTYRRDNWQDQPCLVEVWSEKSTVCGVLEPVLVELGVTFRVLKGFGSHTSVRQAAEDSITGDFRPMHALYLGDFDPSGLYMSEVDLPSRLERYGSQWEFRRIALVEDDLESLPSFSTATKSRDTRTRWYRVNTPADPHQSWELDAMDPNDLRDRVRSEIESLMDFDAWHRSLEIERAEKASLIEFLGAWEGRLST
jgi:hypothetical protein